PVVDAGRPSSKRTLKTRRRKDAKKTMEPRKARNTRMGSRDKQIERLESACWFGCCCLAGEPVLSVNSVPSGVSRLFDFHPLRLRVFAFERFQGRCLNNF